jgi:hypothetical protein
MKYLVTILAYCVLLVTVTGCKRKVLQPQDWYDKTKLEILKQSELKPDSVSNEFERDSTLRNEHSFFGGREFQLKAYLNGTLALEKRYSKDGTFGLVREICSDGTNSFEGISFKGRFYGISRWRFCDKAVGYRTEGIRFKDEKIGVWRETDNRTNIVTVTDYKRLSLLDSMPEINAQ